MSQEPAHSRLEAGQSEVQKQLVLIDTDIRNTVPRG